MSLLSSITLREAIVPSDHIFHVCESRSRPLLFLLGQIMASGATLATL